MTAEPSDPPPGGPVVVRDAAPTDVPRLLELFAGLAEYERMTEELAATPDRLTDALFGSAPAAEAILAERGAQTLGYALFFPTFSSFLASRGAWLEDLFVTPSHRGEGIGRALMTAVATRVHERGGKRLEWAALDWNEPALGFYDRLGADTQREWITHRLDGHALTALAESRR